jgi:hypothetical protein
MVYFYIFLPKNVNIEKLVFLVTIELPIIKREHFNRWYSPSAYYLALTITDIPFTIISTLLYVFLSYIMTNQPLEEFRILTFSMILLLTSFTAQGFGLFSGSLFKSLKVRSDSFTKLPLYVIFGGLLILVKDTSWFWQNVFELSYVKQGL